MRSFKIIVDGPRAGVTSFIKRYIFGSFDPVYMPTNYTANYPIILHSGMVELNIIDLAGDLLYKNSMYEYGDAYILFVNFADERNVDYVGITLSQILQYKKPTLVCESFQDVARNATASYFADLCINEWILAGAYLRNISAADGRGIDWMMRDLVKKLIDLACAVRA